MRNELKIFIKESPKASFDALQSGVWFFSTMEDRLVSSRWAAKRKSAQQHFRRHVLKHPNENKYS